MAEEIPKALILSHDGRNILLVHDRFCAIESVWVEVDARLSSIATSTHEHYRQKRYYFGALRGFFWFIPSAAALYEPIAPLSLEETIDWVAAGIDSPYAREVMGWEPATSRLFAELIRQLAPITEAG